MVTPSWVESTDIPAPGNISGNANDLGLIRNWRDEPLILLAYKTLHFDKDTLTYLNWMIYNISNTEDRSISHTFRVTSENMTSL